MWRWPHSLQNDHFSTSVPKVVVVGRPSCTLPSTVVSSWHQLIFLEMAHNSTYSHWSSPCTCVHPVTPLPLTLMLTHLPPLNSTLPLGDLVNTLNFPFAFVNQRRHVFHCFQGSRHSFEISVSWQGVFFKFLHEKTNKKISIITGFSKIIVMVFCSHQRTVRKLKYIFVVSRGA